MILEVAIGSVAVVMVASLAVADRIHKRLVHQQNQILTDTAQNPGSMKAAILERRRILERDRAEFLPVAQRNESREVRLGASARITEIDNLLLKLAEDESKIPPDET